MNRLTWTPDANDFLEQLEHDDESESALAEREWHEEMKQDEVDLRD